MPDEGSFATSVLFAANVFEASHEASDTSKIGAVMKLDRYETMDVHLLFGLVNTELRNHAESLHDLCRTHDLDEEKLCTRLATADYEYVAELNQFR